MDGFAQAGLDAPGIAPSPAFGVVPDEDRLPKGDPVHDSGDASVGRVGFGGSSLAVAVEALGALLGALGERRVFVADLAGQLFGQLGAFGRPHGRYEEILLRGPDEARAAKPIVDVFRKALR